jgi:hypothetical protein
MYINPNADSAHSPLYAASALAANSFARSSFAAAFPLFGIQSKKYNVLDLIILPLTITLQCTIG